ncbi:MAG: hypothetical protein WCK35_27295 [Chloroflexota bacterium]
MEKITRFLIGTLLFTALFGCSSTPISNSSLQPKNETATQSAEQPTPATATAVQTNEIKNPTQIINCSKIAFTLADKSDSEIYTVCSDGSNLKNLTDNPASPDFQPAWSPNSTRIAFVSSRTGSSQIYVMVADGRNLLKITADAENDFPIWLPASRGKQIAFRSTDGKGLWWWRIVDIEKFGIVQLTEPSYDFFFQTPDWSPDGKYMAYMSLMEQKQRNDGSSQIHVKNADSSNDRALTADTLANKNPVWSPDGSKIAFLSERDGTYDMYALYVMAKDGLHLQKLTEPVYSENIRPTWSPDGKLIAIGNDTGRGSITIIDVATGNLRDLLRLPDQTEVSEPAWQPDK